jgi:sulfite reductase (NADPH) flavoprotein alpha-component
MHWNDVFGDDLCINAVTGDAIDPLSQQPELKFCAVALSAVTLDAFAPLAQAGGETISHAAAAAVATATRAPACAPSTKSEELEMPRIEALTGLLQLARAPAPSLTQSERAYLAGFVNGLRSAETQGIDSVPVLPASAPFDPASRLYVDGLLAGLYSRSGTRAPATAGSIAPPQSGEMMESGVRIVRARPKVTLLWASQTGNTESLTERYATRLMESGFEIRTSCMADYPLSTLARAQYVLLMSSTFGDGDPPDNAQAFWSQLAGDAAPRLDGVRYAVLALGDRNYDQFCAHGRRLDERLGAQGALRLMDRVDCDSEYQAGADAWLEHIITRIKEEDAALHAVPAGGMINAVVPGTVPTRTRPAASRLVTNLQLNKHGAAKDTRYFSLSIAGSELEYEAGDALGVWPANCPELVDELIGLCGLSAEAVVNVAGAGDMRLADALGKHYEIARANPDALAFIAARTKNRALRDLLSAERKTELKQWLWGQQLADVLHEFPLSLTATELTGMLKRLQPRLYSIASSPKAHPGEVHLTVAAVRYNNGRRHRKGVSSTFLADRAGDVNVPVFVQKSAHFRPPHSAGTPIIMVGPGTGVAPFRGFLHERRARGDQGRNWLFFGEQHAATDFYYRDELETMRDSGLLTRLDVAFSRDQAEKVYVQDRMREHGAQLWAWLEDGAHFYVCGDASRMARDVDAALRQVVARHGGMNEEKAAGYVTRLAQEKRYVRDVY